MSLTFGSVCSGIEAASVAWKPLGWQAAFLSEIEAFPRAVLKHHYPETPLHGDFTTIRAGEYAAIDLLVGGTPCQSFSVAGLRGGLDDQRGNLALEYLRLADRLRPRWLVWENVPGVLSSNGGRDFGSILGGLVELGYGFAYRVLDAQFFGVAQRRRRVFVVGHIGDWRRAAAVLFERHSLQGHPAPRREAGERAAFFPESSIGGYREDDAAGTLRRSGGVLGGGSETFIADTVRSHPRPGSNSVGLLAFDARQSDVIQYGEKTGPLDTDGHTMAICFSSKDHGADAETDLAPTLRAGGHDGSHANAGVPPAVAFIDPKDQEIAAFTCSSQANGFAWERDYAPTINAQVPNDSSNLQTGVRIGSAVRRLTPRECERLQGFPDDYTLIDYRGKPAADGPRYKALGNSMAVPVMAWIGRRIAMVDAISVADVADLIEELLVEAGPEPLVTTYSACWLPGSGASPMSKLQSREFQKRGEM